MKGLTDYITVAQWCDILTAIYVLVDDAYQIVDKSLLPDRKFAPVSAVCFGDSEIISLALFGEMVFSGDESKLLHFIRQYHLNMFPNLLDNSRFNRRRHKLVMAMEAIRIIMRDQWRQKHPLPKEEANIRIVDSAPVPMCTYTRGGRCKSVAYDQRDEWFGVCTSKKSKFFGARCHALVMVDQMIDTWLLAPGSYDDRKPMPALLQGRTGFGVIADKGYVGQDFEDFLWEKGQNLMFTLKRDNQQKRWPKGFQRILGAIRHRVETVFSVLVSVFNFDKPRSRSMSGFVARATTKILAHTISFHLMEIFAV